MPRLTVKPPRLCRHKGSGQACVYVEGRAQYLGRWGSAESREGYVRFVAEWATKGGATSPTTPTTPASIPLATLPDLTVSEAMLSFWTWAQDRYRGPDGEPTRTADGFRLALRPLRKLHGALPLAELSPNRLREVQNEMLAAGLTRQTVNGRIGKIRQFVSWCVGRELCHESIARALEHVEPVKPRPDVREGPGRRPVSWTTVEATLPHLPEMLQALVKVLWFTGARVGEVRRLTTGMIDRTGEVWVADLAKHKTAWAGKSRTLLIGPEAQEALRPWIRPDEPDAVIFSPKRLEGATSKNLGRRAPGEVYHRVSLPQAMRRACAATFPHPTLTKVKPSKRTREQRAELKRWEREHRWSLAQLRHSRATELREQFGIETAALVLGHSRTTTTAGYSREAIAPAVEAIRRVG